MVEKAHLCYTCYIDNMDELSGGAKEAHTLIQQLANSIRDHKCTALAVFVLELLKPFGLLAGQALWVADPVLKSLTGHSSRNYAFLLEDHRNIERLLADLEGQPLDPKT